MELEIQRHERINAPLQLVWEEMDSLDQILAKTPQISEYDVVPGGQKARGRTRLTWGPVKWSVDVEVTLTGPIAAKYASATENQRQALGKPLTGDRNAGARESGVVFQQFQGGVITAKNDEAGTPGYITWGKIREAWNVPRDPEGVPAVTGDNGSVGPLGAPTSDENTVGDLLVTTFEHGKIEYDAKTDQVEVTVNGKVVPSGL